MTIPNTRQCSIQLRIEEDWRVLCLILVFIVIEVALIANVAAAWNGMSAGDRWGSLAGAVVVFPAIIGVFSYGLWRVARVGECPRCRMRMRRLPRPDSGPYRHRCSRCEYVQSTGVFPRGGPGRTGLGRGLLDEENKDDPRRDERLAIDPIRCRDAPNPSTALAGTPSASFTAERSSRARGSGTRSSHRGDSRRRRIPRAFRNQARATARR